MENQVVNEPIKSNINAISENITSSNNEIKYIEIEVNKSNSGTQEIKAVPSPTAQINVSGNVSAFSLASIRAKKELQDANKSLVKEEIHLPTEAFAETDLLLHWNKYAQRLSDKGHKIMESLLLINEPKINGSIVIHELPNQGSKIDFENEKHELLGYLRSKLRNHDIMIEVVVNESIRLKRAFSPQERFNRLTEINPALELLRKTFELDI